MFSSESKTKVILKTPNDWDKWNNQFKAEAARRDLLQHIEGAKNFLSYPTAPEASDY